jgi:uncharacterized membrane protein YuzA (DUF378 family)
MFGRKKSPTDDVRAAVQENLASRRVVIPSGTARRLDGAATAVLALGVANWVSVSLFNFDLVQAVAGRGSRAGRIVYGVIGASALYAAARGTQYVERG